MLYIINISFRMLPRPSQRVKNCLLFHDIQIFMNYSKHEDNRQKYVVHYVLTIWICPTLTFCLYEMIIDILWIFRRIVKNSYADRNSIIWLDKMPSLILSLSCMPSIQSIFWCKSLAALHFLSFFFDCMRKVLTLTDKIMYGWSQL